MTLCLLYALMDLADAIPDNSLNAIHRRHWGLGRRNQQMLFGSGLLRGAGQGGAAVEQRWPAATALLMAGAIPANRWLMWQPFAWYGLSSVNSWRVETISKASAARPALMMSRAGFTRQVRAAPHLSFRIIFYYKCSNMLFRQCIVAKLVEIFDETPHPRRMKFSLQRCVVHFHPSIT